MAKVIGIGGIFFKAKDPEKLCQWYGKHLGLSIASDFNGATLAKETFPDAGYAVWSPFAADTDYFEPSKQPFMINLIVDDVDGALSQVKEGGAEVVGEPQDIEFGKFGWFVDPEGNKVELWEPKTPT